VSPGRPTAVRSGRRDLGGDDGGRDEGRPIRDSGPPHPAPSRLGGRGRSGRRSAGRELSPQRDWLVESEGCASARGAAAASGRTAVIMTRTGEGHARGLAGRVPAKRASEFRPLRALLTVLVAERGLSNPCRVRAGPAEPRHSIRRARSAESLSRCQGTSSLAPLPLTPGVVPRAGSGHDLAEARENARSTIVL